MSPAAAAVLIAAAPDAGRELGQLLGAERAEALSRALLTEAERWAREVAGGDGVRRVEGALADAIAFGLRERGEPLLVAWPVLARFRTEHATAALGDLSAGCDLVIGPLIDGGLYLLGLARPLGELVAVPDEAWSGPEAMPAALEAAAESGREVGLLRAERALRKSSDVPAALADPLTPEEIGRILGA